MKQKQQDETREAVLKQARKQKEAEAGEIYTMGGRATTSRGFPPILALPFMMANVLLVSEGGEPP